MWSVYTFWILMEFVELVSFHNICRAIWIFREDFNQIPNCIDLLRLVWNIDNITIKTYKLLSIVLNTCLFCSNKMRKKQNRTHLKGKCVKSAIHRAIYSKSFQSLNKLFNVRLIEVWILFENQKSTNSIRFDWSTIDMKKPIRKASISFSMLE